MQIKSQTQSRQDEDVFSVASKPACYFVKQQVQLAQNPKNENRVEFKFDNEDKKIRDFFDKSNQLLPIVTLGFEQEQERILRSMITKVLKFGKMDQIRSGVALQLAAPKTYSWLFQKRFQYIKDANWIRQFQRFPFIVDQSSVEWVHIAHQKRDDEERLKNQRQYSDNQQIIYQNLKVPYRESPPLMDNQLRRMRWLLANFGDVKQDIDMSTSIYTLFDTMSNLILSTAKAQNHTIFLRSLMNFQKTVICSHDSSPLHMLKNSQSQDLKYQQIGQNLQSAMEQLQQTKHVIQNLTERLEEAENQLNHVNNLNQSLQLQNSLMKKEFQVQERYCKEVCNLNSLFENRIQVLQHQKQNSEELAQHHLDDLELFRQQQSHYQDILSQQLNDLNVKLDQKQDQIAHLSVECAAHKSSQCGKCPLYEFDIQTLQTRCQKLEETLFSERQRFQAEREKLVRDHSAISQFAKQMLEDDLKSQSTVEMDKDYLTKLVAKLQSDKGKLQAQVEVLSRDKSILQNLQPHDLEFSCQQNESQSVLLRSVLFYEQKFTEFAAEAVSQSQQLENLLALVESKSQQTQELEKEVDSLLQIKSGAGLRNVSAVKRISSLQSKICELEQQQGSNLDQKSIKQKLDELVLLVGVDNCSDIVLNLQLLQEIEVNDEKSEQLLLDGCSIVEQKIHTLRNQLQVGLKQLLHMLEM